MNMYFRKFIYKYLWWTYRPLKNYLTHKRYDNQMRRETERLSNLKPAEKRVFYLGITNHPNLGDMGQHYCIKNWIAENLSDYTLEMFEADPVVYPGYGFLDKLGSIVREQDIIIFQSGYCTQDLGGFHNLMHTMVAEKIPNAKILMLPQTVFFQNNKNQEATGVSLSKARRMLFLARDFVSFEAARKMMPNTRVEAFPDIVTTLIGTLHFDNVRDGVCICTRNDGEKLYSDAEIDELVRKINNNGVKTFRKDTQAKASVAQIRANLKNYIENEIESYSHYKVTITDRYHGTIFSLCAGTPVIIIKTTDHKVTTGADWFKGVYDDYVYVADSLVQAYNIYHELIQKDSNNELEPYFKKNYYDKLAGMAESVFSK